MYGGVYGPMCKLCVTREITPDPTDVFVLIARIVFAFLLVVVAPVLTMYLILSLVIK